MARTDNRSNLSGRPWRPAALVAALALAAAPVMAGDALIEAGRNYDARAAFAGLAAPAAGQLTAAEALRRQVPELTVRFDPNTGATRILYNRTGYLTGPQSALDAQDVALDFVRGNLGLLGLAEADLVGHEVTDRVYTQVTGATHLYLRQVHAGIPVYNGQLHVNVNRDGRIISVNNAFLPDLAQAVNGATPALPAAAAVAAITKALGLGQNLPVTVLSSAAGPRQATRLEAPQISLEPIEASLVWVPVRRGMARLAWNFQVQTLDHAHWYDLTVDAQDGRVWTRFDWVNEAQYRVYPQPVESPIHTSPAPPADARQLVVDVHDVTASPFGWHDTNGAAGAEFTIHRGNNVHAYEDSDNNGAPPAVEPDCGAPLNCDFPLDLTMDPTTYRPAAVTNLFYWNNILHDVQYQYGFDEEGGNFQVNNYGNPGLGNDDVRAEAQDGAGTNNANFATPPDGQRPRMQMFLWNQTTPRRDGDFDSGIICHEYGHGISIRQVGGPSNSGCLNTTQQPGEGWSDWIGLVYTGEPGDQGTDVRGVGTYALGQPPNGQGIRQQPYSTDPTVNTWTYENIAGTSVPHGVGSRWGQAIWEVYWALVDEHGFDPDLYDALGGAGNQRAMLYVNEGFKNTACGPSFLDTRDAIIQATVDNFGGEDTCLVWEAFAGFGLGVDAATPGPNSQTATNGFDIPLECQCVVPTPATSLAATPNGDNRIDLSWTASPSSNVTYEILRSVGGCPLAEAELLAEGLTGTSFSDLTASGGTQYSYVVRVRDETGLCVSDESNCQSATATGLCIRPPSFAGITDATTGQSECVIDLEWDPATQHCGTAVSYNVYRSTTPDFTPGPANLRASCVTGTTFSDTDVASGTEYFYTVRAEDDSGNGGGPCAGGNEDGNSDEVVIAPTGPAGVAVEDDVEAGTGNWTLGAGPADTTGVPWMVVTTASNSPTHAWFVSDPAVIKDQFLILAAPVVIPAGSTAALSFFHRFDVENTFDGGVLEYSTDGGATWHDIEDGDGGSVPPNPARFIQGGYNGVIDTRFMSPISGRDAWTGNNGVFEEVVVDLADMDGESVRLRWRFASDNSVSDVGWWVDDVEVVATNQCTGTGIFADGFESGDTSAWSNVVEP